MYASGNGRYGMQLRLFQNALQIQYIFCYEIVGLLSAVGDTCGAGKRASGQAGKRAGER